MKSVVSVFSPFMFGLMIAFVVNVPMNIIENQVLGRIKYPKTRRILALGLTTVIFLAVMGVILLLVVPEVVKSAVFFQETLPDIIADIELYSGVSWAEIWSKILAALEKTAGDIVDGAIEKAALVLGKAAQIGMGCVFAVYVLVQKEQLGSQVKIVLPLLIGKKAADTLLRLCALTNKVFVSYLTGQCTEAVILGGIFLVVLHIFRFPHALLISLLICVLAFIPIVGSFIGCAAGVVLIAVTNSMSAVWFLIIFLCIQQIEGNFIFPRIVGKSVGLPPIWVFSAITIGGGLFGAAGIFMSVPVGGVLYNLGKEMVKKYDKSS